jgi:hypothetical protein
MKQKKYFKSIIRSDQGEKVSYFMASVYITKIYP